MTSETFARDAAGPGRGEVTGLVSASRVPAPAS